MSLPGQVDVLVAGSGAAGLTAALAAAANGSSVLLVERGEHLGGTTALSGGRVWVPGNHLQDGDSLAAAQGYLAGVFSGRYPEMTETFLRTAPDMLRFVESHSAHRFAACPGYPTSPKAGRARPPAAGPSTWCRSASAALPRWPRTS